MIDVTSRRDILKAAALLPSWALLDGLGAAPLAGFTHGVASGDPQADRVVLWTRYVPASAGEARLRVEVADDPAFRRIVARGTAACGPGSDYCAHSVPTGLRAGRWYYYRFVDERGMSSPVGRTRTLPAGSLDRMRIGVFSCANATSGWFNAYAHAAMRDDLDLIVHTGDYIYESPVDRSDALASLAAVRNVEPKGEAISLADYRLRYASYRADPGLMELHRRFPMIAIWDDHEVANNSWRGGAKAHGPEDGPWEVRKAAGIRAFREWLPMGAKDYDRYQLGDLATLFRVETRLIARSRQLELDGVMAAGANRMQAAIAFRDGPLVDPERTMMGRAQEKWLADGLAASTAAGTRWQLIANQVIVSPSHLPTVDAAWYAPGVTPTPKQEAELAIADQLAKLHVPTDLDRWDGYPAARTRLLEGAAQARADLIILTGDSHNAWAFDLAQDKQPIGVEFAGHSVSSLGIDKRFGGDAAKIAAQFVATNPNLRWCDTSRRGYMVLDLTREAARNEWLFLPSREGQSTKVIDTHVAEVARGARRIA